MWGRLLMHLPAAIPFYKESGVTYARASNASLKHRAGSPLLMQLALFRGAPEYLAHCAEVHDR